MSTTTHHQLAFPGQFNSSDGMTLRAYLAGRAMQGLLAGGLDFDESPSPWVYQSTNALDWNPMACDAPTYLARLATQAADALIAELSK